MAHITDYVKWRGDLTFKERPFCIEDNLVLSELIYTDFKEVLDDRDVIRVADAVDKIERKGPIHNTRAGTGKEDVEFVLACKQSRRFGEVVISDFVDILDLSDRQFAAITYILDDGTTVITFRGTDSTIIGWKEDFMISYTHVPSQELALEYARKHVGIAEGKVIICGHSKGAHLSLYAAAHLTKDEQEKVDKVYMNDGPGFCEDILNKDLIDTIRPKLVKITPEYSMIGRIFETQGAENYIVRSSAKAILQHNIRSWRINGYGLITCEDHAPESYLLNNLIERFVNSMDLRARENFVDSLFDSMSEGGATSIREFASQGPSAFENIVVRMADNDALAIKKKAKKIKKKDDATKNLFVRLWGLVNRVKIVRIAISLFLGALCFSFPDFAMETVVYGLILFVCIYEVVLTAKHLKESDWNFKKERPRVTMCIILWVIASIVLVKEGALFVISSVAIGIVFLTLAYQNLINFRIYSNKLFERFRYSFEGIATLLLGGYILVTPDIPNSWYMYSCGGILLIDAFFETVNLLKKLRKAKRS